MAQPKPLTRDQLAKFLGNNQEAIRRFEELFQIAGTITPDQVVILFRLAQEIAIDATNAQAAANSARASLELLMDQFGLSPTAQEAEAQDDLETKSSSVAWGEISGDIALQADLQAALAAASVAGVGRTFMLMGA